MGSRVNAARPHGQALMGTCSVSRTTWPRNSFSETRKFLVATAFYLTDTPLETVVFDVFPDGKLFVSGEIVCSAHLDTAEDLLEIRRTLAALKSGWLTPKKTLSARESPTLLIDC
ncbi:hypothetical protein HUJ04_004777 [Dendroctonus ponderosae]|nr:hypothetical protein HUJ04_004777 [Dendroctonus ponderosae]KAH1015071.1 hypothetical protein HUJ05_012851 [Dendroctonus ponderosae]